MWPTARRTVRIHVALTGESKSHDKQQHSHCCSKTTTLLLSLMLQIQHCLGYITINKSYKLQYKQTSAILQVTKLMVIFAVCRCPVMNKFIHHEGRLNNNMQKWRKEKEKENNKR